jgi:hypothetical protein
MAKRKGLPWVMVSVELEDHPKTQALVRRLGQPFAALYLVRVWAHFGRWHEDGCVTDSDDAVKNLEAAAKWDGNPGDMVAALLEAGFLDRPKGRIAVHNWSEWSGKYAERKAADRQRKNARGGDNPPGGQGTVPQDIQRNSGDASPSPSPSPSLASEGDDQQQGYLPASPKAGQPTPNPFWNDDPWYDRIRRSLPALEREAFDEAVSAEMTAISRAHPRQGTPEWIAAEVEARQRLEETFPGAGRRPQP